jgi:O-glycosyl hydrolase
MPQQPPADASVQFDRKLRDWDGFGVNYVEAAGVMDVNEYKKQPEDYGGFSKLSEQQRQEIVDLIFGPDGLKPGILKMFLDPLHEGMTVADKGKFDHETSTRWMNYFVAEGLKRTRARGQDLPIITSMWSPPGWMTKQKFMNGRDLDPQHKEDVAGYMIHWVKYLRNQMKFPVKYLSVHNEGDMWQRWPADGSSPGRPNSDYAMFWSPAQIADFLCFMRPMMDREGLKDVGLTNGEPAKWDLFAKFVAPDLIADPEATKNIALITSHGFGTGRVDIGSLGIDTLRVVRPELHAWTTSMNVAPAADNIWIEQVRQNIYDAKVNGLIPWSVVASDPWTERNIPSKWNDWVGTGIWVDRKGGYQLEGYYLLKHVFRAGQPGMAVAEVSSSDPNIGLIAFARNGSRNPDALVVNNLNRGNRSVAIRVSGTAARAFDAFITDPGRRLNHDPLLGTVSLSNGVLTCAVPGRSVITFIAKQ